MSGPLPTILTPPLQTPAHLPSLTMPLLTLPVKGEARLGVGDCTAPPSSNVFEMSFTKKEAFDPLKCHPLEERMTIDGNETGQQNSHV